VRPADGRRLPGVGMAINQSLRRVIADGPLHPKHRLLPLRRREVTRTKEPVLANRKPSLKFNSGRRGQIQPNLGRGMQSRGGRLGHMLPSAGLGGVVVHAPIPNKADF
jgi:hypothetical protein